VIAQLPDANAWPLDKRIAASRQGHLSRFAAGRAAVTSPASTASIRASPRPVEEARTQGTRSVSVRHPLELWLIDLRQHPGATLAEAIAASSVERQNTYVWLFCKPQQDRADERIRNQLELEAFVEIQRSWRKLGYPLTRSRRPTRLRSVSSGDRPAALAELMGIIQPRNADAGGAHRSLASRATRRMKRGRPSARGRDAYCGRVTEVVRKSLLDVVNGGTAVRLRNALARTDRSAVEVGGKTGTGDHRIRGARPRRPGSLIAPRSRSATFYS